MEVALAILLVAVAAAFVLAPLRGERGAAEGEDPRLLDLRTRKAAKLAEIREAELDHAQGKLSQDDHRRIDRELRAEAIGIIKDLETAEREAAA